MALPAPTLDDRRFQQLVDDAKRHVQQHCPRWTDHNVSDPGITLIEAVASMTEQLIYRLNRVPDRQYIKFLELLGVTLFPPTAARVPMTFWLSAAQPDSVKVPAGQQVSTVRTEADEAITFETVRDLSIIPASLQGVGSMIEGGKLRDMNRFLGGEGFHCFDAVPKPGDALYVALTDAVPSCALVLRFECEIEGAGVDPKWPPLAWEAWDGEKWTACDVESDDTGGLNKNGDLILHVPETHAVLVLENDRAGWIRGRVTPPEPKQRPYAFSPLIKGLSAFTIGGTVEAMNAELVEAEDLGVSDGAAGQRFPLQQGPVVPSDQPPIVEVSTVDGWVEWMLVSEFSTSTDEDLHYAIDQSAGEVQFGPAVRLSNGEFRQFGAIPAKGSRIRIRRYRVGGGQRGNVSKGMIRTLRSSIPYVARVENRRPAQGGVDAESLDNAKLRGPIELRTRRRAVTAEDFEHVAREAAPEAARIRAVAAGDGRDGKDRGGVRVLVVPNVASTAGRLDWEQLDPPAETLKTIRDRLEERRVIGSRILVGPPLYKGVTVVARLRARARRDPASLRDIALERLFTYLNPVIGGPDYNGWPFGRPVNLGEIFGVLQAIPGTELVEDVRLFAADPVTGKRGQATQRIELEPHSLVFSYQHQVLVDPS